MRGSLKASYTVEAAVIISFSFIVFGMAIAVAYDVFQIVLEYVSYKNSDFDAVSAFRLKESVVGIWHAIRE
jgi:hypothetical protein